MRVTLLTSVRLLAVLMVITGLAYPLGITVLSRVVFPVQAGGSLVYERRGERPTDSEGARMGAPERTHRDVPDGERADERTDERAGGRADLRVIGSVLIGQSFTDPRYFWGRPSATTPPYNGAASSGSNLGPSNPALADSIRARAERFRSFDRKQANPAPGDPRPGDLAPAGLTPAGPARADLAAIAPVPVDLRADLAAIAPVPVDLVTTSASGLDPHISPASAYYQVSRVARHRGLHEAALRQLVARFIEPRQLGFLGEPRVNVLRLNQALDRLTESR